MRTLQQNQHREIDFFGLRLALGLRRGGESDEPALRAESLWRRRRSGLAEDIKRKRIKMSAARGSVAHSSRHAFSDNRAVSRRDFDSRAFDGASLAVVRDARLQQMPAVHQGGVGNE